MEKLWASNTLFRLKKRWSNRVFGSSRKKTCLTRNCIFACFTLVTLKWTDFTLVNVQAVWPDFEVTIITITLVTTFCIDACSLFPQWAWSSVTFVYVFYGSFWLSTVTDFYVKYCIDKFKDPKNLHKLIQSFHIHQHTCKYTSQVYLHKLQQYPDIKTAQAHIHLHSDILVHLFQYR